MPASITVPTSLRRAVGGHPLIAQLLAQRGMVDPQRAVAHLDPDHYQPASPWALPGMDAACSLLLAARDRLSKVRVWGDIDTDGLTATALLLASLRQLGLSVDYDLPGRHEGHGLFARAVDQAQTDGIHLLLTCDTGIGDGLVVRHAVDQGMTVIITDHHDLPVELPPAQAIVNPKMLPADHPLAALTGVGVAYQLVLALAQRTASQDTVGDLLDLVAIGTIADIALLTSDTRYLVQRGLRVIAQSRRPGLQALAHAADADLAAADESTVSFIFAPRLNAAGRLGDARQAIELLLIDDAARAAALAERLEGLNRDRRAHTEALQNQCEQRLQQDRELLRDPALLLDGSDWEAGVLGVVAGNLARKYERPVVLVAHTSQDVGVASARSVEGIDIHEAIAAQEDLLIRQGGHPMAAGFSIKSSRLQEFRRRLMDWLRDHALEAVSPPALAIDAALPWPEIGLTLAKDLRRLGPFGSGNPQPVFCSLGGRVVRSADVSYRTETAHRRVYLVGQQGDLCSLVWFHAGELPADGQTVDVAYELAVSQWRGERSAEPSLLDWRPAELAVPEPSLVAGRQIIDWRQRDLTPGALEGLRASLGADLQVWAEGLEPAPPGTVTRLQLHRGLPVLALLTPPRSAAHLRSVLELTEPQVVYLLPPMPLAPPSAGHMVKLVGDCVRRALAENSAFPAVCDLAALLGVSEEPVRAILRGLAGTGRIGLVADQGGLALARPHGPSPQRDAQQIQNAREALLYWVHEMRAYQEAYRTLPLAELLERSTG
jgi:single-stranded-DNA-specific exonuclease